MCRGDLTDCHLRVLNLQATSLWELVDLQLLRCCHGHRPRIRSMLLRDRKGKGNEKNRRENHERGEWGIDRMCSKKQEKMEKKGDKTTTVRKALLYSNSSKWRNEDQSQHPWLLYKDLLKGGLTLKFGLSLLSLSFFVGPRPILNGIQMNGLCYLHNMSPSYSKFHPWNCQNCFGFKILVVRHAFMRECLANNFLDNPVK